MGKDCLKNFSRWYLKFMIYSIQFFFLKKLARNPLFLKNFLLFLKKAIIILKNSSRSQIHEFIFYYSV